MAIFFLFGLYYQAFTLSSTLNEGDAVFERVTFFGTASIFLIITIVELHLRGIKLLPSLSTHVGNSSYSLYLSHTIILTALYFMGVRDAIKDYGEYQGILMFGIILLIVIYSIFHYKYIELPLINYAKKIKPYIMQKIIRL